MVRHISIHRILHSRRWYLLSLLFNLSRQAYTRFAREDDDFQAVLKLERRKSPISKPSVLEYHRNAMALLTSVKSTMLNPATRINHALSENTKQQMQRNRKLLKSIMKAVEICVPQGWALRGHRDAATSDALRKGNVNALFQFHIDAGDHQLKDHLETCARNATYISKTCHNDLLICIKDYIQDAIISDVKTQSQGPLYTVEADEVTDVSNWEQMGLVIRYLRDAQPVERLVEYVQCESTKEEAIFNNIQRSLTSIRLHLEECRGQTYDGAGNKWENQRM